MTANFTGSLRLLVGLGWPLIFITRALFGVKKTGLRATVIRLEKEHAVEVVSLFVPILYFVFIYLKASLNLIDAAILLAMYVAYLKVLSRIPPQESESIEDIPRVSRWALSRPGRWKLVAIFGLFLGGGLILYFVAHPFYQAMLGMAVAPGLSVRLQQGGPLLSEFPEKVTAFNWARTGNKASLALMNMVSSNINQWTVLAAMIPIVYSISRGEPSSIPFDAYHRTEILLTVIQSFLGMLLLANLEFRWYEAIGLFVCGRSSSPRPTCARIIRVHAGGALSDRSPGRSRHAPSGIPRAVAPTPAGSRQAAEGGTMPAVQMHPGETGRATGAART
jgi:cation:H+ antiporter